MFTQMAHTPQNKMKSLSFAMVLLGLTIGPCDPEAQSRDCSGGGGPVAYEYSTVTESGLNIIGKWNVLLWYIDECPGKPNPVYALGIFDVTSMVFDSIHATLTTDSTGVTEMRGFRNGSSFSFTSSGNMFNLNFTMITTQVGEGRLTTPMTYQPKCRPSPPSNLFYFDMRR